MQLRGKPPAEPGETASCGAGKRGGAGGRCGDAASEKSAAPAPPKSRIADVTELRRMDGMTPALYRQIAPHLTVYSRDGRINPFHASRAVLLAVPGLSEIDVDRFLDSARAGGQRRPAGAQQPRQGGRVARQSDRPGLYRLRGGGQAGTQRSCWGGNS